MFLRHLQTRLTLVEENKISHEVLLQLLGEGWIMSLRRRRKVTLWLSAAV